MGTGIMVGMGDLTKSADYIKLKLLLDEAVEQGKNIVQYQTDQKIDNVLEYLDVVFEGKGIHLFYKSTFEQIPFWQAKNYSTLTQYDTPKYIVKYTIGLIRNEMSMSTINDVKDVVKNSDNLN